MERNRDWARAVFQWAGWASVLVLLFPILYWRRYRGRRRVLVLSSLMAAALLLIGMSMLGGLFTVVNDIGQNLANHLDPKRSMLDASFDLMLDRTIPLLVEGGVPWNHGDHGRRGRRRGSARHLGAAVREPRRLTRVRVRSCDEAVSRLALGCRHHSPLRHRGDGIALLAVAAAGAKQPVHAAFARRLGRTPGGTPGARAARRHDPQGVPGDRRTSWAPSSCSRSRSRRRCVSWPVRRCECSWHSPKPQSTG